MSPAIFRGVMGSCLALGVADLAWLDANAERMTSSAPRAATNRIEPPVPTARIERLPPLPSPAPISDEIRPHVMETERRALPPQPEHCVVHFDIGVAVLSDDEAKMLIAIADALKKDPRTIARVDGHADRMGWIGKGNNLVLSEERAGAVVRALGKLGIARDRVRTAAYGDTRPVDDGSTGESFRRNRRAEVRIELTGDG